jgi:Arc/MetJ-type ribon-helix-helix transcriptional regulator
MKLSVSLSDDDVALLDDYIARTGLPSRSAALHKAIRMLRHPTLEHEYGAAWEEWSSDDDSAAWDGTAADGLGHVAR